MLRNYLKTSLRHLFRNKLDAFINIGGLALGAAIAILIGLWVHSELSFNSYHDKYPSIGQVYKGSAQKWLPYQLALELKENYHSSFKEIVTVMPARANNVLSSGEKVFSIKGQYVEPGFPEMFSLDMIEGDRNGLTDPHSILISQSTARTFFGDDPAVDKLMRIDNRTDVKVTGVYRDLPDNSEFNDIKFLSPWDLLVLNEPAIPTYGWDNHFVFVYVELNPGVTFEEVAPQIAESELKVISTLDYMKEQANDNSKVWLQPMSQWHLHSTFDNQTGGFSNGPLQFVYLVAAIGVFVVILACINFMNLATARSEKRMREVGVRKAIGSLRLQLIGQFYCESFVVVFLSLGMAIILAAVSLPWFNNLSGKELHMPWTEPLFWIGCVGLMTLIATVAGSYPALYLSSFKPSVVLKGNIQAGGLAQLFRRILVTVQFTVSIILIVATIAIYKQIMFTKGREVGYLRGGLMIITGRGYQEKYEAIRRELLNTGVVAEVAGAGGRVTAGWSQGGGFEWAGMIPDSNPTFGTVDITPTFGRTVGWEVIAGRDFDENNPYDSSAFVINEAAAKEMGFEDPVGQTVHWKSKWHGPVDKDFRIVGVVRNLILKSPYTKTQPAVFYLRNFIGAVHIRIADGVRSNEAVSKVEAVVKKMAPEIPFDFTFADSDYNKKFAFEDTVGRLASTFSILAIIISCLGLFGMASFMTQRRTKEIGIRKVVGASVFRIWKMMSTEFVIIVVISFIIAAPVAWFGLDRWLQNFVYRTDVSWEVFVAAGIGALVVTLLTISWQLLKAANQSPVRSLRTE